MFAHPSDTALHHEQQAVRHRALAGAARQRGSMAEADYQTELALRHIHAAQLEEARHWPLVAPTPSVASVCMRAFQRCVGRVALQIRALLPARSSTVDGLSQR